MIKQTILSLGLLGFATLVFAQQGVVNESFVIRKNRTLSLPKADRSFFPASLPESGSTQEFNLTFDSITLNTQIQVQLPGIEPARMESRRQLPTVGQHLIKIGGGNLFNTLASYQYINPADQKRRLVVNLAHEGFAKGPVRGSESSENFQGISFNIFQPWKKWTLTWKLSADRNQFNYYGLPDSLFYSETFDIKVADDTRYRIGNQITIGSGSKEKTSGSLSVQHRLTNYQAIQNQENWLRLSGMIDHKLNSNLSLHELVRWNYLDYTSINESQRSIFQSTTLARFKNSDWMAEGGINLFFIDSLSGGDKQWYAIPHAKIARKLSANQSISLELTGGYEDQSLYSQSTQNVYLDDSLLLKTNLMRSLWTLFYDHTLNQNHVLRANLSYATIRNQSFFINDSNDPNLFQLIYDSTDVGRFKLELGAFGEFSDKWTYQVDFAFQQYYLDTLSLAYHVPKITTTLKTGYQPIDKLRLNTSLTWMGGIEIPDYLFPDQKSAEFVLDWRFSANYDVNKKVSAYTELYNLLNQSNSRYYLYPARRIWLRLGVYVHF